MQTKPEKPAERVGQLGPFHVSEFDYGRILDADGFIVANVDDLLVLENWQSLGIRHWAADDRANREIPEEQVAATATLFAAAPDLLAACKAARELAYWADGDSGFASDRVNEIHDMLDAAIAKAIGEAQ